MVAHLIEGVHVTERSDRNWTIVQMIYRDSRPVDERHPAGWATRCERFVVMTPSRAHAKCHVMAWLDHGGRETYGEPHEIYYYPRNYVTLRDSLTAAGRVIGAHSE